jgi:hypothetical protein
MLRSDVTHMENIAITHNENTFHIEGFPDAVKVLKITGPKSKRLADLALHKMDLDFALKCLETINNTPSEPSLLREVLWQASVIRFIKCFGGSYSRFSLDPKVVYKDDIEAVEAFNFFLSLRNKNIVHDENSYTQCLPGAALNKDGMDYKIAKIICLSTVGTVLGQGNYNNLHLLATNARKWVISQFDKICHILTAELEARPYNELLAMEGIAYTAPAGDDVHKPRASI